MIVREGSLIIQNVICVNEVIPHEDWFKPILGLRHNLVNEDIYYTSPVIFKMKDQEDNPNYGTYTYYIGLNSEVDIPKDAFFEQVDVLEIGPAIYVRCSETEELEEAYALLENYAKEKEWKLDHSFYHVTFDLFDDVIIDIYAKVEAGDNTPW